MDNWPLIDPTTFELGIPYFICCRVQVTSLPLWGGYFVPATRCQRPTNGIITARPRPPTPPHPTPPHPTPPHPTPPHPTPPHPTPPHPTPPPVAPSLLKPPSSLLPPQVRHVDPALCPQVLLCSIVLCIAVGGCQHCGGRGRRCEVGYRFRHRLQWHLGSSRLHSLLGDYPRMVCTAWPLGSVGPGPVCHMVCTVWALGVHTSDPQLLCPAAHSLNNYQRERRPRGAGVFHVHGQLFLSPCAVFCTSPLFAPPLW